MRALPQKGAKLCLCPHVQLTRNCTCSNDGKRLALFVYRPHRACMGLAYARNQQMIALQYLQWLQQEKLAET